MKRVLIVDDARDVADALGELLEESYEIGVVYSGADALAYLEERGADAVVLDVMMPGMSGEELMAILHARAIAVPVLFVSAAPDLAVRARRSRVADFISKPFRLAQLEAKLAVLLGEKDPGGNTTPTNPGEGSAPGRPSGGMEARPAELG